MRPTILAGVLGVGVLATLGSVGLSSCAKNPDEATPSGDSGVSSSKDQASPPSESGASDATRSDGTVSRDGSPMPPPDGAMDDGAEAGAGGDASSDGSADGAGDDGSTDGPEGDGSGDDRAADSGDDGAADSGSDGQGDGGPDADAGMGNADCGATPTLHPGASAIKCPNSKLSCTPSNGTGQFCCLDSANAGTCQDFGNSCASGETQYQCIESAQCPAGNICCGGLKSKITFLPACNYDKLLGVDSLGTTCVPGTACTGTDEFQVCGADSQCPASQTCKPFKVSAIQLGRCQ